VYLTTKPTAGQQSVVTPRGDPPDADMSGADAPRVDTPGLGTPSPWPFLRQLETDLRGQATPHALIEAVLHVFEGAGGVAAGWIGRKLADGSFAVWSATAGYRDIFTETESIAWLPDDPTGRLAAIYAAGTSRIGARTAVILLHGQTACWGILVLAAERRNGFPATWTAEIVDHFGTLVGNALEARDRQAAMMRVQTLYKTLLGGAEILMKARSEASLLRRICAELAKSGLFASCRIGELDDQGQYRRVIVHAAGNTAQLRRLMRDNPPDPDGISVTARAWRQEKTAICNDYLNDAQYRPWHGMAREAGWRAMAAMPVFRGGRRWAVLTVDATAPAFFDDQLQGMLEHLAGMVGHALDELDLKQALRTEREAHIRVARQDSLTGMPNRLALYEFMRGCMAPARRRQSGLGIGMLDIDDFRRINDNFGHAAGDAVLREVASRLAGSLRDVDFVARIGGDEFALVLEDWGWAHAPGFCNRLQASIGEPITLPGGATISVTVSLGFTLFPLDDAEPEMLLRHADLALYAAKAGRGETEGEAAGTAMYRLYQQINPAARAPGLVRALLRRGAVVVHYQPVIDIQSGEVVAVEALARLDDDGRLLPPASFLKDMHLSDRNELFHQVLDAGLRQLRVWDAEGQPLSLSVNVDSQILLLRDTPAYLNGAMAQAGIAPQRLILEILETHEFLDLKNARRQLGAVRDRGIRIALDDLGAGYSSILKLRDLPIDVVKLDRAFTAGLRQQPDDLAFIAAFQILTRTLGMVLVVEGVESDDILDALHIMGASLAQGFGIARPMEADMLSDWMRDYRPRRPACEPATLLGAYAVHLIWTQTFQSEPTRGPLPHFMPDPNPFALERFFEKSRRAGSRMAKSYRDFQALLRLESRDRAAIEAAAAGFRNLLVAGLAAEA
jgi:diguanylate cyclase (GGDEF)-like protein